MLFESECYRLLVAGNQARATFSLILHFSYTSDITFRMECLSHINQSLQSVSGPKVVYTPSRAILSLEIQTRNLGLYIHVNDSKKQGKKSSWVKFEKGDEIADSFHLDADTSVRQCSCLRWSIIDPLFELWIFTHYFCVFFLIFNWEPQNGMDHPDAPCGAEIDREACTSTDQSESTIAGLVYTNVMPSSNNITNHTSRVSYQSTRSAGDAWVQLTAARLPVLISINHTCVNFDLGVSRHPLRPPVIFRRAAGCRPLADEKATITTDATDRPQLRNSRMRIWSTIAQT